MKDLSTVHDLSTDIPAGQELCRWQAVFDFVTSKVPVFKLLSDQIDENCFACHRKLKKERPLQAIHKGCRLTANEMRSKVKEVEDLKEQKILEKKEKVAKKDLKLSHQKLAKTAPECVTWDPRTPHKT